MLRRRVAERKGEKSERGKAAFFKIDLPFLMLEMRFYLERCFCLRAISISIALFYTFTQSFLTCQLIKSQDCAIQNVNVKKGENFRWHFSIFSAAEIDNTKTGLRRDDCNKVQEQL